MSAWERLKNEDGFGPHFEGVLLFLVVAGVIASLTIPYFKDKTFREEDLPEGVEAIVRVEGMLENASLGPPAGDETPTALDITQVLDSEDEDELICPSTGRPFRLTMTSGGYELCCPDPEGRLVIGVEGSCVSERGWRVPPGAAEAVGGFRSGAYEIGITDKEVRVRWRAGRAAFVTAGAFLLAAAFFAFLSWEQNRTITIILMLILAGLLFLLVKPYGLLRVDSEGGLKRFSLKDEPQEVVPASRFVLAASSEEDVFVVYRGEDGDLRAYSFELGSAGDARHVAEALHRVMQVEEPAEAPAAPAAGL